MNKTFIEREILLQIKRHFTKDEVINDLNRQLKAYALEVGVLKSEVEELKHLNKDLNIKIKARGLSIKEWQKDDYIIELKTVIKRMVAKNSLLKKEKDRHQANYINLLNKKLNP